MHSDPRVEPEGGLATDYALLSFLPLIEKYNTFLYFMSFDLQLRKNFSSHGRIFKWKTQWVFCFIIIFPLISWATFFWDWASFSLGRDIRSMAFSSLASASCSLSPDPLVGYNSSVCWCSGILVCCDLWVPERDTESGLTLHISNKVALKDRALPTGG